MKSDQRLRRRLRSAWRRGRTAGRKASPRLGDSPSTAAAHSRLGPAADGLLGVTIQGDQRCYEITGAGQWPGGGSGVRVAAGAALHATVVPVAKHCSISCNTGDPSPCPAHGTCWPRLRRRMAGGLHASDPSYTAGRRYEVPVAGYRWHPRALMAGRLMASARSAARIKRAPGAGAKRDINDPAPGATAAFLPAIEAISPEPTPR